MQIGTPLSSSALKVMLLGGGELGKEVVIALQRLGVETIVVDRYANTPAMQVAHRSHVVSMTDPDALRQVIREEQPQLIVPEIEAIATDVLLEIEAEGHCKVIPSARAVNLTMITQIQNEFELHARAILGLPVNTRQRDSGASHVIYAGVDGTGLVYVGLDQALQVPNSDLRLFGKPEGFIKRRMGVALAHADTIETARENAHIIANSVKIKL